MKLFDIPSFNGVYLLTTPGYDGVTFLPQSSKIYHEILLPHDFQHIMVSFPVFQLGILHNDMIGSCPFQLFVATKSKNEKLTLQVQNICGFDQNFIKIYKTDVLKLQLVGNQNQDYL